MTTRRDILSHASLGIGGIALAQLLARDSALGASGTMDGVHHPAKAKRLIHIFLGG